ncbi:MAG: hypothetical protein ACKO5E_18760 [bacterium]
MMMFRGQRVRKLLGVSLLIGAASLNLHLTKAQEAPASPAAAAPATAEPSKTMQVLSVPLGGRTVSLDGDKKFGIYVPTRFGGSLTVDISEGTITNFKGPDGRAFDNGAETAVNQHGWYTFDVKSNGKPYFLESRFVQVGKSARRPWNFYYWPTKADAIHEPWAGGNGRVDTAQVQGDDILLMQPGSLIQPGQDIIHAGVNGLLETVPAPGDDLTWFPNLYDDLTARGPNGQIHISPAPLLKFDELNRTMARQWEAANSQNQDISRWPGHCLGGAVASILLNEPIPQSNSGMTRDELKALWAELGENHYNHAIGDYVTEVAAGPPRPGPDACDRSVPHFHAMLENHIRTQKKALLGNFRAFPPRGLPNEVWNQGLGEYRSTYISEPSRGERAYKIITEISCNTGASLNGDDDKPRIIRYDYILSYAPTGEVDETNPWAADWQAVSGDAMYCPLNLLEVLNTRWQGYNPYLTEAAVRTLDMANPASGDKPGYDMIAMRASNSRTPNFRPVSVFEAGRAPMASNLNVTPGRRGFANPFNDPDNTPRRGLFGGLFRARE